MAIFIDAVDYHSDPYVVKVECYADTKEEVEQATTEDWVEAGVLPDYELRAGSTCFTGNKEFGILKSDGTWNFD